MPKGPREDELVKFSEDQATRLIKLYESAERDLIKALNRGIQLGTDTAYLRGMMSQVKSILQELQNGSRAWSTSAIPAVYTRAIDEADEQMKKAGIKVGFGAIHQHAAQVLAENTFNRLQDVVQFIGRRVDDIYRKLSLESVRGSTMGYETYHKAANNFTESLAENGVTGFVDKAGKNWDMSTYAHTVAVTNTMQAHLEGTKNRLQEYGRDLVIVSEHSDACRKCEPWEGKVLSLSGFYDGDYPIDGSVDEAQAEGLFHPRCRHAYGLFVPELMDDTFTAAENVDENNADDANNGLEPDAPVWTDQAQAHISGWGDSGPQTEDQVRQLGSVVRQEIEKRQAETVGQLQQELDDLDKQVQELRGLIKQFQLQEQAAMDAGDAKAKVKATAQRWIHHDDLVELEAKKQKKQEELNHALPKVRKEVLQEIRSLGGMSHTWAAGTQAKVKEAFEAVTQYMPTDWLKTSSDSAVVMKGRVVSRGYYSGRRTDADFMLSGLTTYQRENCAAHEFGHRIEHMIPKIRELEYQFYQRRTEGEALKWLGAGYAKTEKTRFDNFLNSYMGKDYGNKETSYYELLSMGLEGLFRPASHWRIEKDTDFYDFILGLVAGVKS